MTGASAGRSPIRVLGADIANKIAAGEVVERPASVVKELVENAVDAGARSIRIEVRAGGKELIRVIDDGCGIPADQAPLAFERHATSKIRTADDLVAIRTLGFRGEALPSIASVSRVECITRTADAEIGVRLDVVRGRLRSVPFGAPVGTQVTVRDLFYNTPARYKFLKTEATERRAIAEYVSHMALAHPEIRFRLTLEGRESLSTPGDGDVKEAIAAVYGRQCLGELVAVAWDSPFVRIDGYVGKPAVARGDRSAESVFVNGRSVRSRLLSAAIEKGYESLLAHRRFPLAVLHLEVDPTLIDVNVHPAKTEIRFKEERETFKAVMLAVRKALSSSNLIVEAKTVEDPARPPLPAHRTGAGDEGRRPDRPHPGGQTTLSWEFRRRKALDGEGSRRDEAVAEWQGAYRTEWTDAGDGTPPAGMPGGVGEAGAPGASENDRLIGAPDHSALPLVDEEAAELSRRFAQGAAADIDPRQLLATARVVGQVASTYLLVPVPAGLWIIDQHVAHERILYERILRGPQGATHAQWLLVPEALSLSPSQAAAVEEHRELLVDLGFHVEPFGRHDVLVRSVPALLGRAGTERLVEIVEELVDLAAGGGASLRERAAAAIACRGAVKAGERLQPEAMDRLVHDLAELENPFSCPHGRPVIIQMGLDEIERRFHRR